MRFVKNKTFSQTAVADGSSTTFVWTSDGRYIIKRIYLQRQDGEGFSASTVDVSSGGQSFVSGSPAAELGPDKEVSPELNIPLLPSTDLSITLTNHEGVAVNIFITVELWSP